MAPMLTLFDLLPGATSTGFGQADAFERDGALHLHVDLPGVARDDVDLLIDEGSVTVRAERRMGPDPTDRVLRQERGYGSVERTFTTRRPLDADAAHADLVDGVLVVAVPFADAKAGPRRIALGAPAETSSAAEGEQTPTSG